MRNTIKTIEHYIKYIEQRDKSNERFAKLVEDNINNPKANLAVGYHTIMSNYIHKVVALYTAGNSISEIISVYSNCVDGMQKSWDKESGYIQMVWLLSIGILIRTNDETFGKLAALVDRDNEEDYLINYLIAFRQQGRKLINALRFEEPYQSIAEATQKNKQQAESDIKQYLEKKWYKGHSDSYWYDNHKSKHDTYFGYWSFESAAVTVIMGLDDSGYRDNQYYPKDLVDYFRETLGNSSTSPNKPKGGWSVFDGLSDEEIHGKEK